MSMKKHSLILTILVFTTISYASSIQNEPIPTAMYGFLHEITALQPYMVSSKEFGSQENQTVIQDHLNNLSKIAATLHHQPRLDKPFFKVMTDILPEHLQELNDSFREGHKDDARSMLMATFDGCSSCHSQVASKYSSLWRFNSDDLKGSKFEKAEFLFAIRQYDDALKLYREVINEFRPNAIEQISSDVLDSLKKKQSIFIRAKKDLRAAKSEIQRDADNKNLPEVVTMSLIGSSLTIDQLLREKKPDPIKSSSKDLEQFSAHTLNKAIGVGWLSQRNTVTQMYIESLLYDFVQNHKPYQIGPGIYYWLAKCEKKTNTSYYFPIAEFYLKECIDRYPLSYEAKLCFNELENLEIQNTTASTR